MSENWSPEQLAEHYSRLKESPLVDAGKPPDVPEALIQAECVKLMEEDGWRYLRTDPVSDRGRAKGFGTPGMADALFLRYGQWRRLFPQSVCLEKPHALAAAEVLWCEFKSRNGKPAKHQLEWAAKERARGALVWIANVDFPASVEGFRQFYRASGLMRRPL